MKYSGSKRRIAKEILPIILKDRTAGQYYVEPFCGGCNLIDSVSGNRIAGDINKYLIAVWKGLQADTPRPREITKGMYSHALQDFRKRRNDYYSDFEIGWIGWMTSYRGRFFRGYGGYSSGINYVAEQITNTEKQIDRLRDVQFFACDYSQLPIPAKSIIYCDIPYRGSKQYDLSRNFDYERFWNWCFSKKAQGHTVFVSEYAAPAGVACVWSRELADAINSAALYGKRTEKLFRV
jgi:DNA adenine methylase